jgi:hypothetical protein
VATSAFMGLLCLKIINDFSIHILKGLLFQRKEDFIYCTVQVGEIRFELILLGVGCARAQAFSRQLIAAEVLDQSRTIPCQISGEHSDIATCSFPEYF